MLIWLRTNIGTIIVLLIVIAVVAAAAASVVHQRRKGTTGCGCGCQNCAMHGMCHGNRDGKKH